MPFVLPTFNVPCNVWHQAGPIASLPVAGPPDLTVMANVSLGRRVMLGTDSTMPHDVRLGLGIDLFSRIMMVPAGTDLRTIFQNAIDVVEVPAGSGAFYVITDVADMAKGFSNEHRVAWFIPILDGVNFLPTPLP